MDKILDHGADVYGLTAHPNRPFVLATCSRDSTLRIWSLAPLVTCLQMKTLAMRPLDELISATGEYISIYSVCLTLCSGITCHMSTDENIGFEAIG